MAVKQAAKAAGQVAHPSLEERRAEGREARDRVPPSGHSRWRPAAARPDPVALLEEQDTTREPDLVPVRHGRMMFSPFTFYRGAATIMAADLKDTPVAGLGVQLCGDAHLSNFGAFASPERRLLFDLNDFDETLPGPFEYDVKRMAASFVICGRNNGFSKADVRAAALAPVTAYWEAMAGLAQMPTMDIWYAHMDEDQLTKGIEGAVAGIAKEENKAKKAKEKKEQRDEKEEKVARAPARRAQKNAEKAHTRDSMPARRWSTRCRRWRSPFTRTCAGGRWRGRMPGPATRSSWPSTSAAATRSAGPSLTFPNATPTRTSTTTPSSSRRSGRGAWRRSRGV